MKIQNIKSAKFIYNRFQKLYKIITAFQKFILLNKLFNIFYVSAENMHKYVSQLNNNLKFLDHLNIIIDSTITKTLVINYLNKYCRKMRFNIIKKTKMFYLINQVNFSQLFKGKFVFSF